VTDVRSTTVAASARVSAMAAGLVGSEILKIAADIRDRVRAGEAICNLTVGDFASKHFPIPERLATGIRTALERGETNYPPSDGVLELRQAVVRFYERELHLRYPVESVLIAGGARPVIYAIYRAVVDPGDVVIYPTPSWNNNHYCHMVGARGIAVPTGPETAFMPVRDTLLAALRDARLICLNTPLNPTGTAISAAALRDLCEAIVTENHRRNAAGERPVYLMYDHVYWMLRVPGVEHHTPPALLPEMAAYTLFVDGISKAFASTGLRVGWAVGPADVVARMSALLGHVGAWAPRPEQVATVGLLDDAAGIAAYHHRFLAAVKSRLELLHDGLQEMKSAGLAVESIPPMGAIYLTARFAPFGRRTPQGAELRTNEDVRRYLLDAAQFAIVPFQAFGVEGESGWFRLSVGAVGEDEIRAALPRVRRALQALA
jgi:aspartate aminotransferase